MKKIQMYINNRLERIDNYEVITDIKGYYIERWDGINLWNNNKVKIYLTDEEVENYLEILDYNKKIDIRDKKIKEAIEAGRVKQVNQVISNNSPNGSGVMKNIYYDEKGKKIV